MGKIVSVTFLHYGLDYLKYAFESLYPSVDRMFVFYSKEPNQGYDPGRPCPDSSHDMLFALQPFWDKIEWIDGGGRDWTKTHIDFHGMDEIIKRYAPDADAIVQLDADEIWQPGAFEKHYAYMLNMRVRFLTIEWFTLWRSFSWKCVDPFPDLYGPLRIYRPKGNDTTTQSKGMPIVHCGYSRRADDIAYKIATWGHSFEVKPGWFEKKFLGWQPGIGDVHPVYNNFWYPKPHDKSTLPAILKKHPYYDLELIE